MSISRTRLDRFISEQCRINRKSVRLLVAQKRIVVDGLVVDDVALQIDKFSSVCFDDNILQANKPLYIMLHKPIGVVSATKDEKHKTVIDVLGNQWSQAEKESLHIVGRLDLNTSGLVLLTNDSRWSEKLTSPEYNVEKRYHVTLANPLTHDYISAFNDGMYFSYEDITTKPAHLEVVSCYLAKVTLIEGKYHQIKRMFGRFRNPVVALHRESVGQLTLDDSLAIGEARLLTETEVINIAIK
jgi:16S rRNA pseudouridine516 synthase